MARMFQSLRFTSLTITRNVLNSMLKLFLMQANVVIMSMNFSKQILNGNILSTSVEGFDFEEKQHYFLILFLVANFPRLILYRAN
jgi:hypothetical protein